MRRDIEVGARFPDYELPDQDGVARRLSDLQGSNPMVLHLSRGGFDPKEHRFLRHLVDAYLDFRVAYTRVVLISTDNQLEINEFRDSAGAQFPFLSDPERTVRNDLDIIEYTDPVHDPMVPHTFVLAPGLEISATTTATGTGDAQRSKSCTATCARSCATCAPISIWAHQDCARLGIVASASSFL
jgi:peroxiredoxin